MRSSRTGPAPLQRAQISHIGTAAIPTGIQLTAEQNGGYARAYSTQGQLRVVTRRTACRGLVRTSLFGATVLDGPVATPTSTDADPAALGPGRPPDDITRSGYSASAEPWRSAVRSIDLPM